MKILSVSFISFLILSLFIIGCGVSKKVVVKRSYVDTKKKPHDIEITIQVPSVKLIEGTQLQKKGGVSVSCEIVPINVIKREENEENVADFDPQSPGYDVFEIVKKPKYEMVPDEIDFIIKIRNNQERVLKLVEVPIILIVDGIQTNIADAELVGWKAALIPKGFEKEFRIKGPDINRVHEGKNIYIAVDDVPTIYDEAGNIKKKENFEWTFSISNEKISKSDKITYTYVKRPIFKEQCSACGGKGFNIITEKCPNCKGYGYVKNKAGKNEECRNCKGTGKISLHQFCTTCSGKGMIEYPKSKMPPVSKEVIWTGWKVRVESNPIGANVKVVNINTGEYKNIGRSNIEVDWYQCAEKSCPIILEMSDKLVKVLPFNNEGKEIGKILVDFTNRQNPVVVEGKMSN